MDMSKRFGAELIGTFWVAPTVGAILAGAIYRWLGGEKR